MKKTLSKPTERNSHWYKWRSRLLKLLTTLGTNKSGTTKFVYCNPTFQSFSASSFSSAHCSNRSVCAYLYEFLCVHYCQYSSLPSHFCLCLLHPGVFSHMSCTSAKIQLKLDLPVQSSLSTQTKTCHCILHVSFSLIFTLYQSTQLHHCTSVSAQVSV